MSTAPSNRLCLIVEVYRYVIKQTQSLEADDHLGTDLAYLLGAIATGGTCEWPENRPLVQLLQEQFGRHDLRGRKRHPVWAFVAVTPAACPGCGVAPAQCLATRLLDAVLRASDRDDALMSLQERLDDLVHDCASGEASDINNRGPEGQLEYLEQHGYGAALAEILDELGKARRP